MISYPLPRFEQQKAEVMQRYRILNGAAGFDTNHAARTVAVVFGVPIAIAALNERYRPWFRSAHGVSERDYDRLQDFCAHAHLCETSFVIDDVRTEPCFADEAVVTSSPRVAFFAGAPLRDPEGKRMGTLCLLGREPRSFTPSQIAVMESFAGLLSNEICLRSAGRYILNDLIEAEEDKSTLYDLAMTDALTTGLNRRAFFHFTEREVKRANRRDHDVSVLMLDIDHFKNVNDVHGHSTGDQVLKQLVQIAVKNVRDEDYVGRLGGEEFAIVLPETSSEGAFILANRLRQKFKLLRFQGDGGEFSVTMSIGVSKVAMGDADIRPALERADKALYEAKNAGRDCVKLAPDPEEKPELLASMRMNG